MTKSIDEWAADKCGVVFGYVPNYNGHGTNTWAYKGVTYYWRWTIKDPRCREIVRECFRIYTYPVKYAKDIRSGGKWSAYQVNGENIGRSNTIEGAECNCIEAIYEAEK